MRNTDLRVEYSVTSTVDPCVRLHLLPLQCVDFVTHVITKLNVTLNITCFNLSAKVLLEILC